jgi:hypothetical protein
MLNRQQASALKEEIKARMLTLHQKVGAGEKQNITA